MRENIIRRVAGTFILLSIGLAYYTDIAWLLFTAFVGVNLIQSSFTGLCPLNFILDKLNVGKDSKTC